MYSSLFFNFSNFIFVIVLLFSFFPSFFSNLVRKLEGAGLWSSGASFLPFSNFSWSTPDLQYCVSFRCTAKWISYIDTYTHSFLDSFPTYIILWPFVTYHPHGNQDSKGANPPECKPHLVQNGIRHATQRQCFTPSEHSITICHVNELIPREIPRDQKISVHKSFETDKRPSLKCPPVRGHEHAEAEQPPALITLPGVTERWDRHHPEHHVSRDPLGLHLDLVIICNSFTFNILPHKVLIFQLAFPAASVMTAFQLHWDLEYSGLAAFLPYPPIPLLRVCYIQLKLLLTVFSLSSPKQTSKVRRKTHTTG